MWIGSTRDYPEDIRLPLSYLRLTWRIETVVGDECAMLYSSFWGLRVRRSVRRRHDCDLRAGETMNSLRCR